MTHFQVNKLLCFVAVLCIADEGGSAWAQSLNPSSPSKEYIYAGGKLVATEEPATGSPPGGSGLVPPPAGILSWWPGDGNADDIIAARHGTFLNGASVATGKVGQAFNFDGVDDSVELPVMSFGNTVSFEFWIFPTRLGGYEHLISNDWHSLNFGALYFRNDHIEYWQANALKVSTPSGGVSLNTWSHIAFTYDGGVARLYVNGTLQGSSSQHTMTFNNSLRFGYTVVPFDSYFKGLLDEISVYNHALSVQEIQSVFNAGGSGKRKYQFTVTTTYLPDLFVGLPASHAIETVFGTPPITSSLAAGTLPAGMTLSQSGVVSGTPTTSGAFAFTVQATDAASATSSSAITSNVVASIPPPADLVSWWPGDGNATDIVGTRHGAPQNGATHSSDGKVDEAFSPKFLSSFPAK